MVLAQPCGSWLAPGAAAGGRCSSRSSSCAAALRTGQRSWRAAMGKSTCFRAARQLAYGRSSGGLDGSGACADAPGTGPRCAGHGPTFALSGHGRRVAAGDQDTFCRVKNQQQTNQLRRRVWPLRPLRGPRQCQSAHTILGHSPTIRTSRSSTRLSMCSQPVSLNVPVVSCCARAAPQTVPVGYWRNFLLPNGMAKIASEGILKYVPRRGVG